MCIIAVKPKGSPMFPDEIIRAMFQSNPDGAGIMYHEPKIGKVVYHKGFMKVDQLFDFLAGKDWESVPAVLHFRIGTSGAKSELLTHPYPVFDENKVMGTTDVCVCHNGILSRYNPAYGQKDMNDSLNFVQQVLSKLDRDFLKDRDKINLINEIIGYNKLAFIDKDGETTLLGSFIRDGDYMYSNTSYKPAPKKVSPIYETSIVGGNYRQTSLFPEKKKAKTSGSENNRFEEWDKDCEELGAYEFWEKWGCLPPRFKRYENLSY